MEEQTARLEEYKTLRDETLHHIDTRQQILSYTLGFAAAMFTLGLGKDGYAAALIVYPVVAFFFATSFSYYSLMNIAIGQYLRQLETQVDGLAWANTLGPSYRGVELLELISTSGLFLGTELIGMVLYSGLPVGRRDAPDVLCVMSVAAFVLTIVACFYPWFHHRRVMRLG